MKTFKIILIFQILLIPQIRVSAQIGDPRRDVSVGVSAGMTMNTVSFYPAVSQTMKMSPMFGLALRYNCEKYFTAVCGLQAEVNYCNLGWKEDFSESDHPEYHYKRNMHYAEVPIMARMGWGREERGFLFYLLAGPQFGYFFGDSEKKSPELGSGNPSLPTARRAQYGKAVENKFDYGITAGVGVELNTRRAGHILFDVRYYLGLADIYNNGKSDYFGRSANSTIVAKFSYLFDVLKTKSGE